MLQLSVRDVHTLGGWCEGEVYSGYEAGGKGGDRILLPSCAVAYLGIFLVVLQSSLGEGFLKWLSYSFLLEEIIQG